MNINLLRWLPGSTLGLVLCASPAYAVADSSEAIRATPRQAIASSLDLPSLELMKGTQALAAASSSKLLGINIAETLPLDIASPEIVRPERSQPLDQTWADQTPVELAQQPDPNEDRFLQPTLEPLPPDTESESEPLPEPPEPEPQTEPTELDAVQFPITTVNVIGSTVFDQEDFAPITAEVEGRSATLSELQAVADAVTQLYLNEGYLTSRAILVDQVIEDGIVAIQIVEGRIGDIEIEGTERLSQTYIRRRVRLGAGVPLRTDRLEDQLRLLRADPLLDNVEASLRAGDELGESTLVVRVEEANAFIGTIRTDNYSPPSVGSERIGLDFGHRNLTGIGDSLIASYTRTAQGGSQIIDLNYRAPVNPMNGTVQLRTVIDRNEVVQEPFDVFDIEGESERYEVSYRQPLVRSPREEFALSVGFAYRDGQVLAFDRIPLSVGANEQGVTRTSVFRFGQDYVRRDVAGAWSLRSQFSLGVDLLNATVNEDLPDGRFLGWLGQAQRVQRLGNDHLLIAQLDLQLTPDALLSSEQFVIGGGQSLRGFRQNARAGDSGLRFSLEDRITLVRDEAGSPTFQVAPFLDLGTVWNDSDNTDLPDQTFLAGIGAGLLWEMLPDFNIRLDFALPLVDLNDRGENIQDNGIYFSVRYDL